MTNYTAAAQQLRISRINMATAVYLLCWSLLLIYRQLDVVILPWPALLIMLVTALTIAILFRYSVASGLNTRFRDASLTLPQLLIASLWSFVPIYYNPVLRGEMLMVHVSIYFFGCFHLKRSQFFVASALSLLIYIVVLILDRIWQPEVDVERELFRFSLFVAALFIVSFIGGYAYDMRRTLRIKQKELQQANEHISKQACFDALTGVYNRRYLIDAMAREEARTKRRGGRFSVVMCDLDHFKSINDRFGHLIGDHVLQSCADTIAQQLRREDSVAQPSLGDGDELVARFGGEEFVLLLPETDSDGARVCAERLRTALSQLRFPSMPNELNVTASFGVACYRPGDSSKDVLARADSALYEAKHAGRNRVIVAQ